jgi:hypothetical protein
LNILIIKNKNRGTVNKPRERTLPTAPKHNPRAIAMGHMQIHNQGQERSRQLNYPAIHTPAHPKSGTRTRAIGPKIIPAIESMKILKQFILPSYISGQPVGLIGLKCE